MSSLAFLDELINSLDYLRNEHSYQPTVVDADTVVFHSGSGRRRLTGRRCHGRVVVELDIRVGEGFVAHRVACSDAQDSISDIMNELQTEMRVNWRSCFAENAFSDRVSSEISAFCSDFGFNEGVPEEFELHATKRFGSCDSLTITNGRKAIRFAVDEIGQFSVHVATELVGLRDMEPRSAFRFGEKLASKSFRTMLPHPSLWVGDTPHEKIQALAHLCGCQSVRETDVATALGVVDDEFWAT